MESSFLKTDLKEKFEELQPPFPANPKRKDRLLSRLEWVPQPYLLVIFLKTKITQ